MWLEEPREEWERRVCEPLKDTVATMNIKGRTIMPGETLLEKLDEAVCCRVCLPDAYVTFLGNVNCKSCV